MSDVKAFDKADHGLHPVRVDEWGCLVFVCLDLERAVAPRRARRSPRAARRLPPRRAAPRAARRVRDRRELEARRRELHGVLPPALGAPGARQGLPDVGAPSLAGAWPVRRASARRRSRRTPTTAAGRGCRRCPGSPTTDAVSARFAWVFPDARDQRPAEPHVPHADATDRRGAHERGHVPPRSRPSRRTPPGTRRPAVDELLAFWDEVNREDIAIVERVQDGLADPAYTGGRMCYRFEESVHRFQNMVVDRMVGVRRVPDGDATP